MLNESQEHILKHLLSLQRDCENMIAIGNQMSTYPNGVDEKELIQILTYLEQINFINIKWVSANHETLNNAIDIILLPNGLNYFKTKKEQKRNNIKDDIKWILPLIISLISLVWNIINSLCYSYLHDILMK